MVVALLLSLAFLTYQPADDAVARAAPLVEALLNPSEYPPVENALGLLGAELARSLVPGFIGYSILLYSLGLMVWGYAIFRHWALRPLLYPSSLVALSAFVVAALIGWFAHTFETDLVRWAGAVGMGMSGWMQGVFGQPGSFILLMLAVAVMLLLVIDHDIQKSVDRVIDAIQQIEATVQSWIDAWKQRRARKKEARRKQKEAQRKEQEARRNEQEAEEKQEAPSPASDESNTADDASASGVAETTGAASDAPSQSGDADDADEASTASEPDDNEPSSASADDSESSAPGRDPRPVTIQIPENAGDGRPLRRNDLFREQVPEREDKSPDDADNPPTEELDIEELADEFDRALQESSEDADETRTTRDESEETGRSSDPSAPAARHDEQQVDAPPREESQQNTSTSPENASAPEAPPDEPPPPSSPSSDAPPAPDPADPPEPAEATSEPPPDEDTEEEPPSKEDDVELTVKERVEEEKAEEIERPVETPEEVEYESPPLDLLEEPTNDDPSVDRDELEKNKEIILDKLDTYNIEIDDISAVVGPTVTRYELTPAPGVKVSRITSLEDDLAMALAAPSVRMIAPIPGKSAVGVEIPNSNRELVRLREVLGTAKFRDTDMTLPMPMGKTIEGEVFLADLTKMPHLLIAGATGSGKSVGLNSLITGLIYACHPMNLRFVVIDPKKIELQQYTALETQFVAQPEDIDQTVITDIEEASGVLKSVEKEMEERYDLLSEASVRGIEGYNEKFKAGELSPEDGHRHMPYVVVVVDELADLMMAVGDDIEGPISRLAQMARAVGIHLVLATQRPSVDVITGVIKANFPSRIAYEVASMADSRTILDQGGAEGLVGNGDLLYLSGSDLRRLQGPFVSVEEVEDVVDFVSEQPGVTPYKLPSLTDAGHGPDETLGVEDTDEHFEEAARVTVRRQQGSVSLLQRKLAVGYTRAARIVDQLEEAGIVGPHNGTKARDVLVDDEQELDRLLQGEDADA
jgi:S-DNA-T family DNA segregation ATPase FtsK/SpoIIIE